MPDQLALRFERERETKNTIRYQELAEDGEHVVCTCAKPSWRGWATLAS
jgi:hypothetical protein